VNNSTPGYTTLALARFNSSLCYDEDLETRAAEIYDSGNDDSVEKSVDNDDFYSYYDSLNPCLRSEEYLTYLDSLYLEQGPPQYDFIFINDNTRSPARNETRQLGLQTLEETYTLLETGATPVSFYSCLLSPYRDMGGLEDVRPLPRSHMRATSNTPTCADISTKISGAVLHRSGWRFFWCKKRIILLGTIVPRRFYTCITAWDLPSGFVVHHTLFGVMPRWDVAVRKDPSSLWKHARRFQPSSTVGTVSDTGRMRISLLMAERTCVSA
jgi:hypothetical protein